MRRKLALPLLVAGAGAATLLLVPATSSADDDPSTSGHVAFDPVTAALGVDTPAEVAALQAQQVALAGQLTDADDAAAVEGGSQGDAVPGSAAHRAHVDFGEAVDALYERVAAHPRAEASRQLWRDCMAASGLDRYDAPVAIEEAFETAVAGGDGDVLSAVEAAFGPRDRCLDATQPLVDEIVEEEFAQWSSDHHATIEAYRAALEAAAPSP